MTFLQNHKVFSSFLPRSKTARPSNSLSSFLRNRLQELVGLGFLAFSGALFVSLSTYTSTDPSWNLAINGTPKNYLGDFGAIISDLFLQLFGPLSYIFAFYMALFGLFTLVRLNGLVFLLRGFLFMTGFLLLITSLAFWGQGGALGYLLLEKLLYLPFPLIGFSILFFLFAVPSLLYAIGISFSHFQWIFSLFSRKSTKEAKKKRAPAPIVEEKGRSLPQDKARLLRDFEKPREQNVKPATAHSKARVASDPLLLPPLDLLFLSKNSNQRLMVDEEVLQQNADALEAVLQDYGIRGEIVAIKPGPVVTLYELEPAPGLKSSRVIALADDIARSMSAISA